MESVPINKINAWSEPCTTVEPVENETATVLFPDSLEKDNIQKAKFLQS